MNVLVGITGSIAAYKAMDVISVLKKQGFNVKVVMSEASQHFIPEMTAAVLSEVEITKSLWSELDGKVNHIELAKWADLVVIVPATANTIAKIAHGIADNVLSTICLAVRPGTRRMIFPAMNTYMWRATQTKRNVEIVQDLGWEVVPPGEGRLACGDTGEGKILPTRQIIEHIEQGMADPVRWPLPGVPYDSHPRGSFGMVRKFDRHTGIDLYAPVGQKVVAIEDGVVVAKGPFTGPDVKCDDYPEGSPWWLPTEYVAIKGESGTFLYGEIKLTTGLPRPSVQKIHSKIRRGECLGSVARVLRHDKGTPTSMLHIELLAEWDSRCPLVWDRDAEDPPEILMDPTALVTRMKWWQ